MFRRTLATLAIIAAFGVAAGTAAANTPKPHKPNPGKLNFEHYFDVSSP